MHPNAGLIDAGYGDDDDDDVLMYRQQARQQAREQGLIDYEAQLATQRGSQVRSRTLSTRIY